VFTLAMLLSAPVVHAGAPTSSAFAGAKIAVFGFVHDSGGNPVPGAVVTADLKSMKIKIVGRTDITGAYTIYKAGDDADQIDASVSCTKDGYRFEKEIPRHIVVPPGQPVEIDCIMTKRK
jgi:hypothetical protein